MRAVFLDRDGTINEDSVGYISKITDFKLFPFAAEAITIFNKLDFKTIVVSNQSGIERGFFTETDLNIIHNYMITELQKENAFIDLILYSPFLNHFTRKPEPGMFFQALQHFNFNANQSFMIGDKMSDIEFGKKNGLITFLVKTGEGCKTLDMIENNKVKPDFVVENILSAANVIKLYFNP